MLDFKRALQPISAFYAIEEIVQMAYRRRKRKLQKKKVARRNLQENFMLNKELNMMLHSIHYRLLCFTYDTGEVWLAL